MIRFGNYTRKISFVSYLNVSDGYSGTIPVPFSLLDTYSDVKQLRGSNDLEAAQLELPKTFMFKVQYRSGFDPNQSVQILYDNVIHVIKGIEQQTERNTREWIITAVRTDQSVTLVTVQNTLDSSLDFIL